MDVMYCSSNKFAGEKAREPMLPSRVDAIWGRIIV